MIEIFKIKKDNLFQLFTAVVYKPSDGEVQIILLRNFYHSKIFTIVWIFSRIVSRWKVQNIDARPDQYG